jgi:clan AA aspartic protease (TIGR02281 family)
MKKLISILFVLVCVQVNAQNVFTKDGVDLGPKSVLVEQCAKGAETAMVDIDGIEVDIEKYCSCVMGEMMPTLTIKEITDHIDAGDLVEFFTTGNNLEIITACATPNMVIHDDYTLSNDSKYSELQKQTAVSECVNLILESPETNTVYSKEQATVYCNCSVEGMYSMGITYGEIQSLDDESQVLFNELIMPCAALALEGNEEMTRATEVFGANKFDEVPIVDLRMGYNVKIGFGDVDRYFMIDSGASDVIINSKLEKVLLEAKEITAENYRGFSEYILADGSTIQCQMLMIDSLKIGNFTVHNVEAAIIPDGSLLLGQSLLKKFTSWKIISEKEVLVLEN